MFFGFIRWGVLSAAVCCENYVALCLELKEVFFLMIEWTTASMCYEHLYLLRHKFLAFDGFSFQF